MQKMRRVMLAAIPEGMPKTSDFKMEEVEAPVCGPNEVLVKTALISVDPYLRGRISGLRSYIDPIPVGSVMESSCVGEVVESKHAVFQSGDWVSGFWKWQEFATVNPRVLLKLNPDDAPVSTSLGILGMPGMTAYFGLIDLCQPKAGETVFVSGAAGAVGSAVGQIATILGCRAVGTAGSAAKVQYVESLGFDAAFDYHVEGDYLGLIDQHCPKGVDCYFDNVGGRLTDDVLEKMNLRGRMAVCGQISQYNDRTKDVGPRPFTQIIVRQLRVEGFIVSRWADRYPEGRRQMLAWYKEGKLRFDETFYDGLESASQAFIGLFRGENTGKALVRL